MNGKGKGKTADGTEGEVIYRETRKLKFEEVQGRSGWSTTLRLKANKMRFAKRAQVKRGFRSQGRDEMHGKEKEMQGKEPN